jgi:hypothetical protein
MEHLLILSYDRVREGRNSGREGTLSKTIADIQIEFIACVRSAGRNITQINSCIDSAVAACQAKMPNLTEIQVFIHLRDAVAEASRNSRDFMQARALLEERLRS